MVKLSFRKVKRFIGSYRIPNLAYAVISQLIGIVGPALIPPCHIAVLYYFWRQFARRVDKRYCSCSCWDTVFKGSYESGVASYKHVYFNATTNTIKIWVLTVIFIIGFYESLSYLAHLLFRRRLRYSMLILFLSAIFSHYYSWWAYFNYLNDDFYSQWNHQLFFTSTELISTGLVLYLSNRDVRFKSWKALLIVFIAIMHVVTGGMDQFIMNVVHGQGHLHQVIRDVNLMIPDLLHIMIPLYQLNLHMNCCNSNYTMAGQGLIYSKRSVFDLKKEYFVITTCLFVGCVIYVVV